MLLITIRYDYDITDQRKGRGLLEFCLCHPRNWDIEIENENRMLGLELGKC